MLFSNMDNSYAMPTRRSPIAILLSRCVAKAIIDDVTMVKMFSASLLVPSSDEQHRWRVFSLSVCPSHHTAMSVHLSPFTAKWPTPGDI